jgi:hypothetical protein
VLIRVKCMIKVSRRMTKVSRVRLWFLVCNIFNIRV